MVKIKNIALKAGVSIATVSHVLNNNGRIGEETRKKVLEVIEELDYKPNRIAKSLKMNRTGTIGVIAEDITVFNTPQIIDGLNEYAEKYGYSSILVNLRLFKKIENDSSQKEEILKIISSAINKLIENQVEGIIYIGTHIRDVTDIFPSLSVPIVYTYCYTTNESDYSVNYNDEQASFEMTNYLIRAGHKRIAIISGLIDSQQSLDRFNGYKKSLAEHELELNPFFIKIGNWEYKSGYNLSKELLTQNDKPTGIVAMNDLMAVGVFEAAKELGIKVPEDLSVVGFDNTEFSGFITPSLTTMALPLHEMGEKSMEVLDSLINKREIPLEEIKRLPCSLIERKSVKFL